MASDYGLNFGFRRSDEALSVREGRFKTPAGGNALLQGSAIEINPAIAGEYKQCATDAPPKPGLRGLLVQEDDHLGSVFNAVPLLGKSSSDRGKAKTGTRSVMWHGSGVKVWLKNTAAKTVGGRTTPAVTVVDLTGVAVGDVLGWDGSKWAKPASAANGWMTVTHLSGTNYCEAVLTF